MNKKRKKRGGEVKNQNDIKCKCNLVNLVLISECRKNLRKICMLIEKLTVDCFQKHKWL